MARPFTPRDTLRLRRQQAVGTVLEVEDVVLVGQSPLWQAVTACWRLGNGHVETLVLDPGDTGAAGGFVQARRRQATPSEFDLVFIAPALGNAEGGALSWQRMIGGACQYLGARGAERVYATVHEEDTVALQVLRHLGFAVVTGDVVFLRTDAGANITPPSGTLVVGERADYALAVRRLIQDALPEPARAAGGTWGDDWVDYPAGGHAPGPVLSRVCLEESGAVRGAWRLVAGRSGTWLRVVARPGTDASPLVQHALAARDDDDRFRARPVFATARDYEPELHLALREHEFEPRARRFRLVKHLAARVLAPTWRAPTVRGRGWRRVPSSSAKLPAAGAPAESGARRGVGEHPWPSVMRPLPAGGCAPQSARDAGGSDPGDMV